MKKGNLIINLSDRHNFYKIERLGKKTALLKVFKTEEIKPDCYFMGKPAGYYVRLPRSKVETYEIRD